MIQNRAVWPQEKEIKKDKKKTKENTSANVDTNDTIDKNDNSGDVKQVKYSKFIPFEVHEEIVKGLNSQIDILKKQLATNEKLVNTIHLREQKEAVIEQQNLIKLQQTVEEQKVIGTEEDNKSGWRLV